MKKMCSILCAVCLLAVMLAACGGDASSAAAPVSSSAPASAVQSTPASSAAPGSNPVDANIDLDALVADLAEGAALGTTIGMIELDLKAAGVNTDNVVRFAGLQSQTVVENGGTVILIEATDGKAADVQAEMEGYRDMALGNEDYAEFAAARDNIAEARIQTQGNFVLYAVSATGDWDTLDATIGDVLAALDVGNRAG